VKYLGIALTILGPLLFGFALGAFTVLIVQAQCHACEGGGGSGGNSPAIYRQI
jgi:hypothetical protein